MLAAALVCQVSNLKLPLSTEPPKGRQTTRRRLPAEPHCQRLPAAALLPSPTFLHLLKVIENGNHFREPLLLRQLHPDVCHPMTIDLTMANLASQKGGSLPNSSFFASAKRATFSLDSMASGVGSLLSSHCRRRIISR